MHYSLKIDEREETFVKKVYDAPEIEKMIVFSEEILLTSGEEETETHGGEENDNPYEIRNLLGR